MARASTTRASRRAPSTPAVDGRPADWSSRHVPWLPLASIVALASFTWLSYSFEQRASPVVRRRASVLWSGGRS
jgi:hypothetical protein